MNKYLLDGKEYSTDKTELSVLEILQSGGYPPEKFVLEDNSGQLYTDAKTMIPIKDGIAFHTKARSKPSQQTISYSVNGETQQTDTPRLTVKDILERAGENAGIIVANIDKYYLESASDQKRYENLDDIVEIKPDEDFFAVYKGPTTVAAPSAYSTP